MVLTSIQLAFIWGGSFTKSWELCYDCINYYIALNHINRKWSQWTESDSVWFRKKKAIMVYRSNILRVYIRGLMKWFNIFLKVLANMFDLKLFWKSSAHDSMKLFIEQVIDGKTKLSGIFFYFFWFNMWEFISSPVKRNINAAWFFFIGICIKQNASEYFYQNGEKSTCSLRLDHVHIRIRVFSLFHEN